MPKDDRREYIKAMLCMMDKKPRLTQFPGVTNRYEDFVAVHINQTQYIHGTGNFLSWHRYYIWAFEEVLRNECGYTGTQPVRVGSRRWSITDSDKSVVLGLREVVQ
jgi:tyrosinase